MILKDKSWAIFSNRGKAFWRAQLIPVFVAYAGVTWQPACFSQTLRESDKHLANVSVRHAPQIPTGYILATQLDRTLSVEDARAGDAIKLRIMQEVPLPNRQKIAFRSVVKGSVLNIARDEDEIGLALTVRFDVVSDHRQDLSVATSLRAIASYSSVRDAQMPVSIFDDTFRPGWANTVQIGGDVRYGDGDSVRNRWNETVGKAVLGGVLVYAKANRALGCEGPSDLDDHPQALWLFSADACGVYGLEDVQLIHNGETEPVGEITLHFKKAKMKLSSGTGILLSVVSQP